MKLINPWENIKIKKIGNKEVIQNFDDDIHLLYVLVGELSVESEGSYLTLQKDDFFILHKSKSYTCHTGDSKVFQLSLQYFYSEEDESDPYSYYFTGDSVKNTHSSDMQVTYLLNQLVELYIFKEQKRISEIFEVYFNLINTLEKKYFVKVQLESDRSIKQKVEEVKFYIDNNFDKEIRLSDLAGKLFVSEQYLSKLFSNEIGLSLSEYLIRKRSGKSAERFVRNRKIRDQHCILSRIFQHQFLQPVVQKISRADSQRVPQRIKKRHRNPIFTFCDTE